MSGCEGTQYGASVELHPMLGNMETDGRQRKNPATAKSKSWIAGHAFFL